MSTSSRNAWAQINLKHLCKNLDAIWNGRPNRALIAVVKADAYGHGAVKVARRLADEGVTMLAVASTAEAAELRTAGIETPILLLGGCTRMECEDILDLNLAASVSSVAFARDLDRAAARRKLRAKVHVKLDTGMSRLGIPAAKAIEAVTSISVLSNMALEGAYTHLACADEEDKTFTMRQVAEFRRVIAALEGMGVKFVYMHAAASAACMDVPEAHFNCLRPGLALYGLHPAPTCGAGVKLKPIMEFASRVVHVERHPAGVAVGYGATHRLTKDSVLAVISAGYADGYDRCFSGKSVVTINGVEAPLAGRVSMDMISVDVTHVKDVKVGDKAVLFSTDPEAPNSVENLAKLVDTIPYTLTCGVSKRVERVYEE